MVRQDRIHPEERIVVLVTGNGLKDVGSAIKASGAPYLIEPSLDELKRLMGKLAHA
jgi:threonine synthase